MGSHLISDNIVDVVGSPQYYQKTFRHREEGSFSQSHSYLDDVFTLKDLLGLKKT